MDFITNTYDEETKSIINLFIFNYKDKYSYKIYQIIINLSIVYLIVIGGFHLSILQRIIRKTIKKPKILSEILGLMVIFFYTYLFFGLEYCLPFLTHTLPSTGRIKEQLMSNLRHELFEKLFKFFYQYFKSINKHNMWLFIVLD